CFFFQAEDGIRDRNVTGVQTCALPIYPHNLIDFHSDCPGGEVRVKLADYPFAKAWVFEIIGAKRGAESGAPAGAVKKPEDVAALWLQSLEEGVAIVNHADVEHTQFQTLDQGVQSRVVSVNVHVRVDGLDFGEGFEQCTLVTVGRHGALACGEHG